MDNWLVIVGMIAVIVIFIFPFLPIGTRPFCAECGSRKIGIQKTTKGFRSSESGEGGDARVQMQYDVKYRCNDCQAQWTAQETEMR